MKASEARILILRFLNGTASTEELDRLEKSMEEPQVRALFEEMARIHLYSDLALKSREPGELISLLTQQTKSTYAGKGISYLYRVAAVIVLLIGLGFILFTLSGDQRKDQLQELLKHQPSQVVLETGDGNSVVLDPLAPVILEEGNQSVGFSTDSVLVYKSSEEARLLVYHTLKVPNGRTQKVLLEDGTQVVLNSGSSLRFPVAFSPDKPREVSLEGEGFFKVSHDEARPFTVQAGQLDISVLGTSFNVTAYDGEDQKQVVLVEGSVMLKTEGSSESQQAVILKPGELGAYTPITNELQTRWVQTEVYTSWLGGELVFREVPFSVILHRLERFYDVTIENRRFDLNDQMFNARFRKESLENILDYFETIEGFTYRIENDIIYIE